MVDEIVSGVLQGLDLASLRKRSAEKEDQAAEKQAAAQDAG